MRELVKQTIDRCRALGLRRTKALEELIATLIEGERPMRLSELAASERLADQCDKANVFRLLQRLAEGAGQHPGAGAVGEKIDLFGDRRTRCGVRRSSGMDGRFT